MKHKCQCKKAKNNDLPFNTNDCIETLFLQTL